MTFEELLDSPQIKRALLEKIEHDKQEMFEAFCAYCGGDDEGAYTSGWAAEMKAQNLKNNFEFYYEFFKAYM